VNCPKCDSEIYLNLSMTFKCGSIGSPSGDYLVRRTTICIAKELDNVKAKLAIAGSHAASMGQRIHALQAEVVKLKQSKEI